MPLGQEIDRMHGIAVRTAARLVPALAALVAVAIGTASAQQAEPAPADSAPADGEIILLTPINVTATRSYTDVFRTPAAVTVLDRELIRERAPDTVADLFRELPGLDVNGVGPNQTRPTIRGQRGQRILLLEDGLRLNNTRRQQDFGEIPSLVDVSMVDRVEVVRGPASVLYGSDAIGGVVNLITRMPPTGEQLTGNVRYRYSTHDTQSKVEAVAGARVGRVGLLVSGSLRDADAYDAPGGSFGEIDLDDETRVRDTGVDDESLSLALDYAFSADRTAWIEYERYRADDAGFGFVDPADYAPDEPFVQIRYPFQTFSKYTLGYRATDLDFAPMDHVEMQAYVQDNERRFDLDVEAAIGPGATLAAETENFTDLETFGLRLEIQKRLPASQLLTYGFDLFRDDSRNTDFSRTTITGFGPPMVVESDVPLVPNAVLRNLGLFVQDEIDLSERVTTIVGLRYQDVSAETEATEGIDLDPVDETDRTVVAAASAVVELSDRVSLVGSVGRGFRVPNLVERFFEGPTPEGGSFQRRTPDLEPETSLGLDVGLRYRDARVYLEGFAFRNRIDDGIRIAPTGETVGGLPEFVNVNVDELLFRGLELAGEVLFLNGVTLGGNATWIDAEDVNDPENPIGESFSSKLVLALGYRDPLGRFWAEYEIRHNGERDDAELGTNPIGDVLPAFTVHLVRGGVTVHEGDRFTQRLGFSIENLTDELYAEFANASFFRPAAGRSLVVTWDVGF